MADPEAVLEAQEQQRILIDAIRALSSRDAIATFLFYYEQYRIQDIALLLGISVTAVKSRLFKARGQLRVLLAPPSTYGPARQGTLQGGNTMVPVVIEGVRKSLLTEQRVVTLLDQGGRRFMNVRVPRAEALTIAMHVYSLDQPHLTPVHFMARTLQSLHVTLEEVQIRLLSGGIFYAVTKMRQGEIIQEGEAKPGEALVRAADDTFLSQYTAPLQARAVGYATDEQVWDAVKRQGGLAIICEPSGALAGLTSGFQPFGVQVQDSQGSGHILKVIGILPMFYGWPGMYVLYQIRLGSVQKGRPPMKGSSTPTDFWMSL